MKPPLWRPYKVNAAEQMVGTKENSVPDPLRYDGHVDAPQEAARMLADLVPGGVARVRCRLWQCRRNKTHLRFLTRLSIMGLFQGAVFAVKRIDGINPFLSLESGNRSLWRRYSLFSWLPIPGIKDMRYQQFAIVAKLD